MHLIHRMEKNVSRLLMIISLAAFLSCGSGRAEKRSIIQRIETDTIDKSILGTVDGDKIIIDKDVDLKGNACKIPAEKTLVFKGGIIKNGVLHGNMTKIECKGKAFNRVSIKGSWDVPKISTKLFADLNYENSIRDVVALAHPKVKNKIEIEKSEYKVRAEKKPNVCISICSNTDFILKGTIRLVPNNLKGYNIIQTIGKNIKVRGNGTIIGDKHTHTGTEGEWGMGIDLNEAINTTVSGLTIKDCWGDCIYVGGNSRNVLIEKCRLDHGRRQGISITKADGVTIRNCTITNVGGTAPEYAIDIEPNKHDSVDNIIIENVAVKDCEGGFVVSRKKQKNGAKTPWIGNVVIKNCLVSSKSKVPVRVHRCEKVKIEKCSLYAQEGRTAITITETGKAIVLNNTASIDGSIIEKAMQTTSQSIVEDNKVVERE